MHDVSLCDANATVLVRLSWNKCLLAFGHGWTLDNTNANYVLYVIHSWQLLVAAVGRLAADVAF